jgi:hypothetical protein
MKIELPDEFLEQARTYIKERECYSSIEAFIEDTVYYRMEAYPWFTGDICVHNENCMHWKSVEDWKKEEEGL